MKKTIVPLVAVLAIAIGAAIAFRGDLQRERARAAALAQRVAVLEPVEHPGSSPRDEPNTGAAKASPAPSDLAVDRPIVPPSSSDTADPSSKPKPEFRGSLQARREVERLQAALVGGTPLQDYQIRALIAAIDQVRTEIDEEKKTSSQAATGGVDRNTESRDRLVQAAADILFESQLETFMELLDRDNGAR